MRLPPWRVVWARMQRVQPGPIGLELGSERLHAVQFADGPRGPEVVAAASVPYPAGRTALLEDRKALRAFLRRSLAAHGFRGRQVVSCLPTGEVRFFPASFAVGADQDEDAALVGHLRARLGSELEQSVVDYLPIRSEDAAPAERDALVVVAPRDRVQAHLSALEGAGLRVDALDVGPAAVARLVARINAAHPARGHANTLVINVGQGATHLTVVWGRRLMLDRRIDFSHGGLLQRVAGALGVDEPTAARLLLEKGLRAPQGDAAAPAGVAHTLAEIVRPEIATLVAEVNKTLIYTASRTRGRSVDQVHLMGGLGRVHGADRLVQEGLSIPVSVLDPLRAFRHRTPRAAALPERTQSMVGMALAAGMALRGSTGAGREIDLVPPAHVQERRLRSWSRAGAVAALTLLGLTAAARIGLGWDIGRMRPQVALQRAEAAAASKVRAELAELSKRQQAAEAQWAALARWQEPARWPQALQSVDAAYAPELRFDGLVFRSRIAGGSPAPGAATAETVAAALAAPGTAATLQTLEIRGHAQDHPGVMAFVRRLSERPQLRGVRLVESGVRRTPGAEAIDFAIAAQVSAGQEASP